MATFNYEIPDALHRALKMEAARRGITLKALVLELLRAPGWLVEDEDGNVVEA